MVFNGALHQRKRLLLVCRYRSLKSPQNYPGFFTGRHIFKPPLEYNPFTEPLSSFFYRVPTSKLIVVPPRLTESDDCGRISLAKNYQSNFYWAVLGRKRLVIICRLPALRWDAHPTASRRSQCLAGHWRAQPSGTRLHAGNGSAALRHHHGRPAFHAASLTFDH